MKKQEIISLIIQQMLQLKQPFTKQELSYKLKEEGIVIENMHAMLGHFINGNAIIASGGKFKVNVQPLFH